MFGWSADVYNQEKLEVQDISNIIAYMRKSANSPLTYIFPGSNPGDREQGSAVFAETLCRMSWGLRGRDSKRPP